MESRNASDLMAGEDCFAIGEGKDLRFGLGSKAFVCLWEVGYGLYSRDVGIAGENGVTDDPCDAAWVMSWGEDGFCRDAVVKVHLITVIHCHDCLGF